MLVLTIKSGEEVILYDKHGNKELGRIKFITPRYPNANKVPLGFDLPDTIRVLRAELVEAEKDTPNSKDSKNANKQQ
jgi:sRNA-binding carbon storage regulator CsrA